MGENSKIEWTDHTFNPWVGCTKVHAGCAHCYAESLAKRTGKAVWGPGGTRVKTSPENWAKPLKWNKLAMVWPLHVELCRQAGVANPILAWEQRDEGQLPDPALMRRPRVFCASLADVFEDWPGALLDHHGYQILACDGCGELHAGDDASDSESCACGRFKQRMPFATMQDARRALFKRIDATPYLDWLLLTKRPRNIPNMWPLELSEGTASMQGIRKRNNVWLGTSISDQATADEYVPALLVCRDLVLVLFLSAEPLLGPIDFNSMTTDAPNSGFALHDGWGRFDGEPPSLIDWVIAGGESGHHARPLHPDWARSLRDQCQAAGVAFHFKQWGEWGLPQGGCTPGKSGRYAIVDDTRCIEVDVFPRSYLSFGSSVMHRIGKAAAGRLLDGRTWDEFPQIPPHDPAAVPGGT